MNQAQLIDGCAYIDFEIVDHLRRGIVLLNHRFDAAARISSGPLQVFLRIVDFVLVLLLVSLC